MAIVLFLAPQIAGIRDGIVELFLRERARARTHTHTRMVNGHHSTRCECMEWRTHARPRHPPGSPPAHAVRSPPASSCTHTCASSIAIASSFLSREGGADFFTAASLQVPGGKSITRAFTRQAACWECSAGASPGSNGGAHSQRDGRSLRVRAHPHEQHAQQRRAADSPASRRLRAVSGRAYASMNSERQAQDSQDD